MNVMKKMLPVVMGCMLLAGCGGNSGNNGMETNTAPNLASLVNLNNHVDGQVAPVYTAAVGRFIKELVPPGDGKKLIFESDINGMDNTVGLKNKYANKIVITNIKSSGAALGEAVGALIVHYVYASDEEIKKDEDCLDIRFNSKNIGRPVESNMSVSSALSDVVFQDTVTISHEEQKKELTLRKKRVGLINGKSATLPGRIELVNMKPEIRLQYIVTDKDGKDKVVYEGYTKKGAVSMKAAVWTGMATAHIKIYQ